MRALHLVVSALLLAAALAPAPATTRTLAQQREGVEPVAGGVTRLGESRLAAALTVPPAGETATHPTPHFRLARKLAQTYYLLASTVATPPPPPPQQASASPFDSNPYGVQVIPKAPGLLTTGDVRLDNNQMVNFLHPLSNMGYGGGGAQPTSFGR